MRNLWRHYLGECVPRYTSYPSALHFDQSIHASDLKRKLNEISLYEPLSLYVHIPFCRQLCWYCGCNMQVENYYDRARLYLGSLAQELSLIGQALGGRGRLTSIHFGGGTPNYLLTEDLAALLGTIEQEIGLTDSADLAIELDPRLLRDHDINELALLGFTRFSLGIQDFNLRVQQAINRLQSYELIEACVCDIRAAGIEDLSFDLLYGLPHQSLTSFTDTIEKVVALSPDRISVFGYAHLPKAFPAQRMIAAEGLPDETLRGELSVLADEKLLEAGYLRIGFDHYAKPDNCLTKASLEGRLKRNFQGFTSDSASSLIGVGASAISFIDGLYTQNEKDISQYKKCLKNQKLPVAKGLLRSKRENITAVAISNLLCTMRTNISTVLRSASPGDAVQICSALERLEEDKIICWRGDMIEIADGAHALARVVAAAIDPYAQRKEAFAAAV